MKRYPCLASLLLCLVVTTSQQSLAQTLYKRPSSLSDDCLPSKPRTSTFDAVFPDDSFLSGDNTTEAGNTTTVTIAQNFKVKYFPTYKEVTNTAVNETYILYQCGGTPPSKAITSGKRVFSVPLSSVMVPDTVPYAFLSVLNVTDRVQSVSTFAVAPCAQQELACNKTAVDTSQLNNATVLRSEVRPFVDGVTATAPIIPPPPMSAPVFTFSAAQDPGILNRAEWIKFMGLFFNREKAASDYFDDVSKRYNDIKVNGTKIDKPLVVAWVQRYSVADTESYQMSFTPYKMQIAEDAGGTNLVQADVAKVKGVTVGEFSNETLDFAWNGTTKGFDSEGEARAAFARTLSETGLLVDETYAPDPTKYDVAAFSAAYPFSKAQEKKIPALSGAAPQVVREDGLLSASLGLDWFEGAIAQPAEVLSDMAGALAKPSSKTREFTWFRNIQQEPVVLTAADCKEQSSCAANTTSLCPLVKECPDGSLASLKPDTTCDYQACDGAPPTNA